MVQPILRRNSDRSFRKKKSSRNMMSSSSNNSGSRMTKLTLFLSVLAVLSLRNNSQATNYIRRISTALPVVNDDFVMNSAATSLQATIRQQQQHQKAPEEQPSSPSEVVVEAVAANVEEDVEVVAEPAVETETVTADKVQVEEPEPVPEVKPEAEQVDAAAAAAVVEEAQPEQPVNANANNDVVQEERRTEQEQSEANAQAGDEYPSVEQLQQDIASGKTRRKFFLHVGPMKTGTSSLQADLDWLMGDFLAMDNFYYIRGDDPMETNCPLTDPDNFLECFKVEADKLLSLNKNIIRSREQYSSFFSDRPWMYPKLQEILKDWDVTIVGGYRPFHEWIPSFWYQSMRMEHSDPDHPEDRVKNTWRRNDGTLFEHDPVSLIGVVYVELEL